MIKKMFTFNYIPPSYPENYFFCVNRPGIFHHTTQQHTHENESENRKIIFRKELFHVELR